jgi:hypothetical protein
VNRSGLTFSAAAAMLLSLPAAAAALPAAASPLPATVAAHAATARAATTARHVTAHRPMASRIGPGTTSGASLTATMVLRVGGKQDRVTMTGSGTMTIGSPLVLAGHPTVPVLVECGPLTGSSPALGRVQAIMEGPQDAWLVENSTANPFPAEQVMPFNDHLSLGAFPGQTFIVKDANSGPAVLDSPAITSFGPQDMMYRLAGPANLEDINHPGQSVGTIQSIQLTAKPTA